MVGLGIPLVIVITAVNYIISVSGAPSRENNDFGEEGYFTVSPIEQEVSTKFYSCHKDHMYKSEYFLKTEGTISNILKYDSVTGLPDEEPIISTTITPSTTGYPTDNNEVKPRLRSYPKYYPEGEEYPPPSKPFSIHQESDCLLPSSMETSYVMLLMSKGINDECTTPFNAYEQNYSEEESRHWERSYGRPNELDLYVQDVNSFMNYC